jgi:ABC-type branched-subunit amino acid transport system substrate-binding protein
MGWVSTMKSYLAQLPRGICIGAFCAFLTANVSAEQSNTIVVGVISPKDGSTSVLEGESHEQSIRLAFNHLGPLQVGDLQIRLELSIWNDRGIPELAAEGALKLVREEHVVAILGPVNSGSTKEMLNELREQQIELPVISSLSTAPELTHSDPRDKNFFRLIFDDAGRMGQYATFIKQIKSREGEQSFLFLYEDNPYGEGLKDSLKDRFYTPNIETRSWGEISEEGCFNSNLDTSAYYEAFRSGQCFSDDFRKLLKNSNINNIVLLGDTTGSLSLVDGFETSGLNLKADYFFVGSSKRLFDEAPPGSLTIGDPVLDYLRAPTAELNKEWNKLFDDFEERAKKDRADFVMTAYEAAMVLHSALRTVLSGQPNLPTVEILRSKLLQVLERETFDSLEPWRTISFSQGKLDQAPTAPIYRITRGVTREDELHEHPWVNMSVQQFSPWLEAPIAVELRGHLVETGKMGVYRVDEATNREYSVEQRAVQFSAGQAVEKFHLLMPGLYRFKMTDLPYYPALTETRIGLSKNYLISAISALVGALLAVSRASPTGSARFVRILTGIATGLLLTFGSLYGQELASWIPFPSFGDEPVVNAMLTGLIGGLLGPYMIANLLLAWANRLLGSRKLGQGMNAK